MRLGKLWSELYDLLEPMRRGFEFMLFQQADCVLESLLQQMLRVACHRAVKIITAKVLHPCSEQQGRE